MEKIIGFIMPFINRAIAKVVMAVTKQYYYEFPIGDEVCHYYHFRTKLCWVGSEDGKIPDYINYGILQNKLGRWSTWF